MIHRKMTLAALSFVVLGFCGLTTARAVEIRITAGEISYPAGTTVVRSPAPADLPDSHVLVLVNDNDQHVFAQRDPQDSAQLIWMLEAPLSAGESRGYRVDPDAMFIQQVLTTCEEVEDGYLMSVSGKPVLRYITSLLECPVEGYEACRRSGFIHPVYSPDGTVVTDDFPPDHPHQHGMMYSWTHTKFHGRVIDFWNSMKEHGIVEHVEVLEVNQGPVCAELVVRLSHQELTPEGEQRPALDEVCRLRVYHSADPFIIDLHSTQTAATDEPLKILEYHYGGMSYRGARQWAGGKAEFLTNEGKNRKSGNHSRPLWTALTGAIDGNHYTLCSMEHATNFRYPQPVRLHPSMPYFCWSPQVLGEFEIAPGKEYNSVYRTVVLDGEPVQAQLDAIQAATATPLVGQLVGGGQ